MATQLAFVDDDDVRATVAVDDLLSRVRRSAAFDQVELGADLVCTVHADRDVPGLIVGEQRDALLERLTSALFAGGDPAERSPAGDQAADFLDEISRCGAGSEAHDAAFGNVGRGGQRGFLLHGVGCVHRQAASICAEASPAEERAGRDVRGEMSPLRLAVGTVVGAATAEHVADDLTSAARATLSRLAIHAVEVLEAAELTAR